MISRGLRPQSRAALGAAAFVSVLLFAGCSAASDSGHSSGDESGHAASGSACDEASVGDTLGHIVGEARMVVASIDSLDCSGDWAFASATLADADASATEGEEGMVDVFLLQRDGDIWVLKARETACGTISPGGPMPADAQVPADLWELACLTS
ncbi:MAG: hypothetical protein F2702_05035 [Actinobacteria bacterium]|uniref:Unannotated protein n=1 Tax=freshwater metagenome TaxID=449393 RepID=A0A6J6U7R2_9ZZZZ|nr:hypothetical protein [Actinomycetota bacterium]